MKFDLSYHARLRMGDRQVTHKDIAEALSNVVQTFPGIDDSTKVIGKTAAGRELKMFVRGTN